MLPLHQDGRKSSGAKSVDFDIDFKFYTHHVKLPLQSIEAMKVRGG